MPHRRSMPQALYCPLPGLITFFGPVVVLEPGTRIIFPVVVCFVPDASQFSRFSAAFLVLLVGFKGIRDRKSRRSDSNSTLPATMKAG